MVNKRGLSPDEFYDLDPEILELLMVYDSYIEPSGTYIDMLFHAHQCHNAVMSNPHLSTEARKNLKVEDFDFLDILGSNMTTKERIKQREKKKKDKQANDLDYMKNEIKKLALRNKNGKQ